MNDAVVERIRRRLRREKKTQQQLAAELGISPNHLSQILTGKRRPSLPVALRLEAVTGVPVREFSDINEVVV